MSQLCNKPTGFKVYDELVPWDELDVKLFCGEATGTPIGMLTTCQPPRSDGAVMDFRESLPDLNEYEPQRIRYRFRVGIESINANSHSWEELAADERVWPSDKLAG